MSAATRSTTRTPPVAELATGALALVVIGGIVMASYVPRKPELGVPTVLLVISLVLLGVSLASLARMRRFAWERFTLVFRWALLAYAISAGMIEFAFVKNHTRGTALVVVSLMLAVYTVTVPLTIAFTVARYAEPTER